MNEEIRDPLIEQNDPADALNDQVTDVRVLNMGTNRMIELVMDGRTAIAATDAGLYIAPEYIGQFSYSISDGVAYVIGALEANSIPIAVTNEYISVGDQQISGQTIQKLTIHTQDSANGPAVIRVEIEPPA